MKPDSTQIYYVHGGGVENGFMESLVGALSWDAAHGNLITDAKGVEGLYIADNRDRACRDFMRREDKAEWMWFIDTDIIFGYDTLELLIASAKSVDAKIMSALYFGYMNNAKLRPVWYGLNNAGQIDNLKTFKSGPQKLGVVGMGCCIIHRSVFETFGSKYAESGWLYFGHDRAPWMPLPTDDNDITPFGEDNCFCFRALQQGITVWGDGSIQVQHRKKRYEDMSTFLASVKGDDEERAITRVRSEPTEEVVPARNGKVVQLDDARPILSVPPRRVVELGEVPVTLLRGAV